jgi:hypothetical protein
MLNIILIVIAIVIVLTLIMFMLLRRIVKTINEQTKVFFMMKLQSYDDMIEAKQQELNSLKAQDIDEKEENVEIQEQTSNGVSVVIPKETPVYKVEGLVDIIRQIDKEFNYDFRKIVLEFINASKNDNNDYYNSLSDIKNKLADYGLFNLITRTKEEQFNIVKELGIIDTELYKKYIYFYGVFMINNFIKFLDVEISKYDPTIYVYVGNEKENYDDLADNVKTIYDKNIIKGVKIKFHNNVYEYHLSY